jgi:glutamine cyclotransferase
VASVERFRVEVLEERPHDPNSFTQGLELDGTTLYESSGLYGESTVRIVDAETGEVQVSRSLATREFAEGLTVVDDTVIVLTWREHTARKFDRATLEPLASFEYDSEGWGLCDDGGRLVMSDGTDTLRFRDRTTFAETGRVAVTLDGESLTQLNELECVDGSVYANVWHTDMIVRIDPGSGRVTATIDAAGLLPSSERQSGEAVLNGIAYDDATGTFLVTGKLWPTMFRVRFVAA